MDHYDLDYEMAIAFRAEILARLQRHIDSLKSSPPATRDREPTDGSTDGMP